MFKIGNRVRFINNWGGPAKGTVGVIVDKNKRHDMFLVKFNNWNGGHDGSPGSIGIDTESGKIYPGKSCYYVSSNHLEHDSPFKIGDKVVYKNQKVYGKNVSIVSGIGYRIDDFEFIQNAVEYEDGGWDHTEHLKLYEEPKEVKKQEIFYVLRTSIYGVHGFEENIFYSQKGAEAHALKLANASKEDSLTYTVVKAISKVKVPEKPPVPKAVVEAA